jgi:NADH dehydrogenase
MSTGSEPSHVIVVGAGFAGLACAKRLADDPRVRVTVLDKAGYHQFQPLLYQVATAELTGRDITFDLDRVFGKHATIDARAAEVTSADPQTATVTLAGGETVSGDVLVLAAGSQPNFFHTPGAAEHAYPLYSVDGARRVRSRMLQLFQDASQRPELIAEGALTFVVVGGGPTGVETAGAIAELVYDVMPHRHHPVATAGARVILVDLGHVLLAPFSDDAHAYAAKQLQRRGVQLRLGTSVTEVGPEHITFGDGTTLRTHLVVWGGGVKAAPLAGHAGLAQGRGGRIDVQHDLTVAGFPHVYALGDFANTPFGDEQALPGLGSVAQQAGRWAGGNILADLDGAGRRPFHYHDKGIMAMIGRKAAVAEIGEHRHEMHGRFAFAAWLGVHAQLLANASAELKAFVAWAEEFYLRPHHRSADLLDPSKIDTPRIDWSAT